MKLKDKLDSSLGKRYSDDIIAKDREERKTKGKKQNLAKKSKGISRQSDQRRQKLQKLKKFNSARKANAPKQGNPPATQRPQQGKPKNRLQGVPKKQKAGGKPQQTPKKVAAPKQFKRGGASRGRRQRGGQRFGRN